MAIIEFLFAVVVLLLMTGALLVLLVYVAGFASVSFTFIAEGTSIIVVRGGAYDHPIMAYNGHALRYNPDADFRAHKVTWLETGDEGDSSESEEEETEEAKEKRERFARIPRSYEGLVDQDGHFLHGRNPFRIWLQFVGWLERAFNVYYMGAPFITSRMKYDFTWAEWDPKAEEDYTFLRRSEPSDFVYVNTFAYAVKLEEAQTDGNVAVNIPFTAFFRVDYPEIAQFRVVEWFPQASEILARSSRNFVGNHSYEYLRTESRKVRTGDDSEDEDNVSFSKWMSGLNEWIPSDEVDTRPEGDDIQKDHGFPMQLGVTLVRSQAARIDIEDDDSKAVVRATTAIYRAELEAKAVVILKVGEAEGIRKVNEAVGESVVGLFVARQKALTESGAGGNTVVFSDHGERGGLDETMAAWTSRLHRNETENTSDREEE